MAKIKKRKDKYEGDKFLIEQDVADAMKEAMLVYGANTNFMRQMPNLIDGLKPVERRILYGMYKMGLGPNKPTVKSARISGEVMSSFHPHGDSSIYDVMVRMTQPWKMNATFLVAASSFGNQYGDPAAAMRYTETKLTPVAWDCYFDGFDINNVFTRPTYDGRSEEPEYLPSKYPVGLWNGCFGIGSGVKVDIPPHNPAETMEYALQRIQFPEKKLKPFYPDSPTGSDIIDDGMLDEVFKGGAGKIKYRGRIDIDYDQNAILLYNAPPMVMMDTVLKDISELRQKGVIKGMISMDRQMVDGSAGLLYYFKKEIDLDEVVRVIYRNTGMESTLPVKFIALDDYREVRYGFGQFIDNWIDIRREYLTVLHTKKLIKIHEEIHMLEIILRIFEGKNAHKTIDYIREKEDSEVIAYLMEKHGITSLQAKTIVQMNIGKFSKTSIKKYKERLPELEKELKRLDKLVNNTDKIDEIIIRDLEEGIRKYGRPRRSRIIKLNGEEMVPNTLHKVVVTSEGYAKKLSTVTDTIGELKDGDIPINIIEARNTQSLLIVDTKGHIHRLPISKLKASELTEHGNAIYDLVKLKGDICCTLIMPDEEDLPEDDQVYLMMVTAEGMIKKTNVREFISMKSSILGMKVEGKDIVVDTKYVLGEDNDIIVFTEEGMGMRYPSAEVKDTGRASKGITALNRDLADPIKGFCIVKPKDKFIFALTEKGKAKKCDLKQFRTMKRDSKALRVISLDEGDGINTIKTVRGKESFRILMRGGIERIKMKEVDELPRLSKGNKMIPVRRGDGIVSVQEEN